MTKFKGIFFAARVRFHYWWRGVSNPVPVQEGQ